VNRLAGTNSRIISAMKSYTPIFSLTLFFCNFGREYGGQKVLRNVESFHYFYTLIYIQKILQWILTHVKNSNLIT